MDDHVGTEPARLTFDAHLLDEVAVLREPGELDDPVERDLPPAPADVRRPQRRDQVARLALELGAAGGERAELLFEAAVGALARRLPRVGLLPLALERG